MYFTEKEKTKLVQGVQEEVEADEDEEQEEEDGVEEDAPSVTSPVASQSRTETKATYESSSGVNKGAVVEVEKTDIIAEKKHAEKLLELKETASKSASDSVPAHEENSMKTHDEDKNAPKAGPSSMDNKQDNRTHEDTCITSLPPPQPPDPKYNVVELLQKGHTLRYV